MHTLKIFKEQWIWTLGCVKMDFKQIDLKNKQKVLDQNEITSISSTHQNEDMINQGNIRLDESHVN